MSTEPLTSFQALCRLTDDALLAETVRLASCERASTAQLIAAIAEVAAREIHRQEGFKSIYGYCRYVLKLSEHAAYDRITAARLVGKYPVILERLTDGSLTLANLTLMAPYVDADTCDDLLLKTANKSKREVEDIIAPLRAGVTSPELYKLVLLVSRDAWEHLHRLQELMLPAIGDGDPSRIVERALATLLVEVEKRKMAKADHPRPTNAAAPGSRHIPAGIKREVGNRDGWQCTYIGRHGRCTETANLELDHVRPFAAGGPTTVDNLRLRCRAHNQLEAENFFGREVAQRRTRPGASSATAKKRGPGP